MHVQSNSTGSVSRRRSTVILTVIMSVALLSWLGGNTQAEDGTSKRTIVCSTTQVADFARQVVGDSWIVECVLQPGADPHLYRTTNADARRVASADLCLANGWHLEGSNWMQNLAADANKPLVECVEGVNPLTLDANGRQVKDPHAWFDPRNAAIYVKNILRAVTQIDPEHAASYRMRAELYVRQLNTLDAWVKKQLASIPDRERILVTSHDAFGYFCNRYDFKAAAPAGWSTGAEVGGGITPQRRRQTVESIRSFGVKAIFVETSVNKKLINEISSELGVKIGGELYSDSMGKRDTAGETYIGMMRENVLTIATGLKGD